MLPAPSGGWASLVHCRLPAGATSLAVSHRTVEEIWHVVGGKGEVWRAIGGAATVVAVQPGDTLTIPWGT